MKARQTLAVAVSLTALVTPHAHAAIVEIGDVVTTPATINYGLNFTGRLTVDDKAQYISADRAEKDAVSVLFGPGGTGLGTVTGAGSLMDISASLTVGSNNGTGQLRILDGGRVNVAAQTTVTTVEGVLSGLLVSGTGSVLQNGTGDFIFNRGTIDVEDGGRINALTTDQEVVIGRVQSLTAELTVQTGGIFDATSSPTSTSDGEVYLGNLQGGLSGQAIVTVQSGGQFLVDELFLRSTEAVPASLTVTGPGTQLIANRRIDASNSAVGGGASSTLVTDGASVQTINYELGQGSHDLTVSDGASVLATGNLQVGRLGGVGTLTVTGPTTTVQANSQFSIAWPGPNSTGTVDIGAGTTLTANGQGFRLAQQSNSVANVIFRIGDDGTGTIASGTVIATDLRFGQGTATLDLLLDPGVTLELGDKFVLIDYGNDGNGIDDEDLRFDIAGNGFGGLADGSIITRGGYDFLIDYDDDLGGGDLAFTATVIPEPTSLALLALGGLLAAKRRKRCDTDRGESRGGCIAPSGLQPV